LFNSVEVKRLGENPGDPFQVMVMVAGKPTNMVDVGYGVSQALPVVIQSVLAAEERLILIQQPEVHLHPKAQASLGSFFVDMVVDAGKHFVVETHSDYIVDRIRQEVAAGKIKPDAVQLLFFEKKGIKTTVYPLTLDEMGNIGDAPPSYRKFFLKEELNLFNERQAVKG
jgi:predicted ATPase